MEKSIQKLLAYRDSKKASDFFEKIRYTHMPWAEVVGFNIFKDEGFKVFSFQYILVNVWIWIFIILIFFSIYHQVELGLIVCLKTAITLGMAFQGAIKTIVFMKNLQYIKKSYFFAVEFLNNLKNPEARLKSRSFAFGGWLFLNYALKYAYTLACASAMFLPVLYTFAMTGKLELPFDIELPFISPDNLVGFLIYMVYLTICAGYMLIGLQTGDAFYSLLLLNGFIQIENIFVEIDELNKIIDASESTYDDAVKQLREVLKLHQDYLEYIQFLAGEFSVYFTTTVVTMVYQIVLSLYLFYVLNGWMNGALMIFLATCQLFIICTFGTLLDVKHDELERKIYTILWYKLEVSEQKDVKLLLQAGQKRFPLEYLFGPLDLQTFVEIYKKIYSAFMMLLNGSEE